jgi:hypothetical protein
MEAVLGAIEGASWTALGFGAMFVALHVTWKEKKKHRDLRDEEQEQEQGQRPKGADAALAQ